MCGPGAGACASYSVTTIREDYVKLLDAGFGLEVCVHLPCGRLSRGVRLVRTLSRFFSPSECKCRIAVLYITAQKIKRAFDLLSQQEDFEA